MAQVARCDVLSANRRTLSEDTDEAAERVMIALLRAQPAWKRLAQVDALHAACRQLALGDLRRLFPSATEAELDDRLRSRLIDGLSDTALRNAVSEAVRRRR